MSILARIQSTARRALGIRQAAPPETITASQALRGRWGRWDSKTTDRMNSAHWAKATGLPINAELAYDSNWLRAQSEYEISSNPVMEGLVNSYITDVVGPEGPSRLIQPAGDPDPEVVAAHLRRQFRHPLGEPGAVADEDESDHARVSAAVAIRSHEEVAPGSW